MLIIGRKVDESIVIDGNIKIMVTSIRGNQVRIGIDAPREVEVMREELIDPMDDNLDEIMDYAAKKKKPVKITFKGWGK